jgi:hypothetical protein
MSNDLGSTLSPYIYGTPLFFQMKKEIMDNNLIGKIEVLSSQNARDLAIKEWLVRYSKLHIEVEAKYVNTAYLACSNQLENQKIVFPVILIISKHSNFWYWYEVKEYDGKSLKYHYASREVIESLTDAYILYDEAKAIEATKWREECLNRLNNRGRNTLDVGDIVEFDSEIDFPNGLSGSIFVKAKGISRFRKLKRENGQLVEMKHITFSITNYRKLNFEVIKE